MTAAMTIEEALKMLAECFGEAERDLLPDRARDDIPGWDSMGALMLMAELDDRCALHLSAEQSQNLLSVGDVLDYLRSEQRLLDPA